MGFRRAAHVTACSNDLHDRAVVLGLDPTKASVIPYGVDIARYSSSNGKRMRAKLNIPPNAPLVGALGRLVYKKGFTHLVAAMGKVLESVPQAYCVIGGAGDLQKDLRDQALDLGIGERVILPGHVDWRDTPSYYAMCDVVAIPSVVDAGGNVDGLPNVLLEAMATSSAVVASSIAGIPEVIIDGENGLLVPPGDEEALSTALISALTSPSLRQRTGRAGQEHISAEYTSQHMARGFLRVYGEAAPLR